MELLKKHLAKSPAFAIIQVGLFETTYIASGMERRSGHFRGTHPVILQVAPAFPRLHPPGRRLPLPGPSHNRGVYIRQGARPFSEKPD